MIWLIGNKGMLGTELSGVLEKRGMPFTGTDREVDITSLAALQGFANEMQKKDSRISVIINCAAYTAVDRAEDEKELANDLNCRGPENIASCAAEMGIPLLHISTDYVFSGNGTRPYREDDETDPVGIYGLTKRDGELAAQEKNRKTWIIRTSWLYGEYGNNFVHTMLRLMREKDELKVVNDQRGSPTWARDLSEVVTDFAGSVSGGNPYPFGVYHYSNEGNITWFDFAREIYRLGKETGLLDPSRAVDIRPCTSDEYPAKVRRPPYSVLDKSKIRSLPGRDIKEWRDSLREFLASIQQKDQEPS